MSNDFNPNSTDSVLSSIKTQLDGQDKKLDRIEDNQVRLWAAHSNLRVKVAGIAAGVGLATALALEWVRSKFGGN